MKVSEIKAVEPLLQGFIHAAIVDAATFIAGKAQNIGNKPQEPDFVASLCINFSADLFQILKKFFPKNRFAVTGVFCHQKPLADIRQLKNPEIGDLLLIYVYTDRNGVKNYNSILLQAKITSQQILKVSQGDEHQLKLYYEWPDFVYVRAGRLNGTQRSILPKAVNGGGQYLLIDDDPILGLSGKHGTFPMGCATPNSTLTLNNNFATEIVEFLKFKSGRSFEADPAKTNDHWTKMIWELLDATKAKATKRKNAGLINFPRQSVNQIDGCCFFASNVNSILSDMHQSIGEGLIYNNDNNSFDEENIGPSVILIESNDEGEG